MKDSEARAIGRAMAERARRMAGESAIQFRRLHGKVTAVNADGTLNVNYGTDERPLVVAGADKLASCGAVAVGARVVIDIVGTYPLVIGTIA